MDPTPEARSSLATAIGILIKTRIAQVTDSIPIYIVLVGVRSGTVVAGIANCVSVDFRLIAVCVPAAGTVGPAGWR
jgi:hypothetical protein